MDIGEQVELRTAAKVGVKTAGLDGQSRQGRSRGEGFGLDGAGFGERIEGRREIAERGSRAGRDFMVDTAQGGELRRAVPEQRPVGDLAPAGRAMEPERNQFRDLFDDFSQRAGAVDVLENAAAPLFNVSQCGGFTVAST